MKKEIKIGTKLGKNTVVGALVKGPWDGQYWTNRRHVGQLFLQGPRGGIKRAFITRMNEGLKISNLEPMSGEFRKEWREVRPESGKIVTVHDGAIWI